MDLQRLFLATVICVTCRTLTAGGDWSPWTYWSTCSVSCNNGYQVRLRNCTPSPVSHEWCQGLDVDTRGCFKDCSIDGQWSPWYDWSKCCGGYSVRLRDCTDPKPGIWGRNCTGSDVDVKNCTLQECRVDGSWGTWHPWSTCSVSCGHGFDVRLRDCESPAPANGGHMCVGTDQLNRPCTIDCNG